MAYRHKAFQTDVNIRTLRNDAVREYHDPTSSDGVKDLCQRVEYLAADIIRADAPGAKMLGVPADAQIQPPKVARAFIWMGTGAHRGRVLHYECDTRDALPPHGMPHFSDWSDDGWHFSGAPPIEGTDADNVTEIIILGLEKVIP